MILATTSGAIGVHRSERCCLTNWVQPTTISTMLDGEFRLQNVCLSMPCIVSERGVEKIIESALPEHELAALSESAATLK